MDTEKGKHPTSSRDEGPHQDLEQLSTLLSDDLTVTKHKEKGKDHQHKERDHKHEKKEKHGHSHSHGHGHSHSHSHSHDDEGKTPRRLNNRAHIHL